MPDNDVERVYTYKHFQGSLFSVHCGNRMGTGWILAASHNHFIVVTAKHVIKPWIKQETDSIRLVHYTTQICYNIDRHLLKKHGEKPAWIRTMDLAFLHVPGTPPGDLLQITFEPIIGDDGAYQDALFHVHPLGTRVGWIGFSITTFLIFGKPTLSLHEGAICAIEKLDDAFMYCIEGTVNQGLSGAPVFMEDDGAVIGIIVSFARTDSDKPDPETGVYIPTFPGIGLVLPITYLLHAAFISGEWSSIEFGRKLPPPLLNDDSSSEPCEPTA